MDNALKTRKKYELRNFKGFDFSSSPLNVKNFRAVKGKNFIFENGINKKRKGYEEVVRIEIVKDNLTYYPKIDGIFEFSLEGENFLICYAGKHFYKLDKNDSGYTYTDITFSSTNPDCLIKESDLREEKIFMFKQFNTVYFVGAGKFICFKKYENFELRLVENNESTYIPTTSINIRPDSEETITFDFYEERNILNVFRKNILICPDLNNDEEITFTLDSGFIDTNKLITLKMFNQNAEHIFTLGNYQNNNSLTLDNVSTEIYGNIDSQNGKIILKNINQRFLDINEIEATFATKESNLLKNLNSCKIGALFGVNGRMDRLFLSKEDYFANTDYYSECEDFSYIVESSQNFIGNEDSKIMAYSLLNDGTLAIQKEYVNGEAGIFYRSSVYDIKFNGVGVIDYINTYFPINSGTIGEGVIATHSLGNLGEDKLFLSQNGVYSLCLNSNLVSTNRYAKERSNYINGKLLKHKDLSKAIGIVYKNKYYLAIDNVVYVADPRFKTKTENTQSDSYDYDWWYWENIPVSFWQIINDELCFGTNDGRICKFDDKFTDRTYQTTQQGDLLINYEFNKIIFNNKLDIKNDNIIVFKNNVFVKGIEKSDILKIENNKIFIEKSKIFNLKNGRKVVIDSSSNTLDNMKEYIIQNIDYIDYSFELWDNSQIKEIKNNDFNLHILIKDERLKLKLIDSVFKITFTYNDNVLEFVENEKTSQIVIAKILKEENVVSEWYTPMLDFGCIDKNKSLLKISLTTEPTSNGKLIFGYRTKDYTSEIQGKGLNSFSFDNIDFTSFSFLTSFANSYTIDVKEDFNYIQFYFKSDTNTDCVIYDVSLIYKENRFNRGVE